MSGAQGDLERSDVYDDVRWFWVGGLLLGCICFV